MNTNYDITGAKTTFPSSSWDPGEKNQHTRQRFFFSCVVSNGNIRHIIVLLRIVAFFLSHQQQQQCRVFFSVVSKELQRQHNQGPDCLDFKFPQGSRSLLSQHSSFRRTMLGSMQLIHTAGAGAGMYERVTFFFYDVASTKIFLFCFFLSSASCTTLDLPSLKLNWPIDRSTLLGILWPNLVKETGIQYCIQQESLTNVSCAGLGGWGTSTAHGAAKRGCVQYTCRYPTDILPRQCYN